MRKTGLVIVGVIIANLAALGVYDLGAQLGWWTEAVTFSEWFVEMGFRYPVIPFFVGLVFGLAGAHFFWPLSKDKPDLWPIAIKMQIRSVKEVAGGRPMSVELFHEQLVEHFGDKR